MHYYKGDDGSVLEELDELPKSHRQAIFKKASLVRGLKLEMAKGLKCVKGPWYTENGVEIYGLRVHTEDVQYRLPFTPFLTSYMVLGLDVRSTVDYVALARTAYARYLESKDDPSKYEHAP